jgi:hypothetical protein
MKCFRSVLPNARSMHVRAHDLTFPGTGGLALDHEAGETGGDRENGDPESGWLWDDAHPEE